MPGRFVRTATRAICVVVLCATVALGIVLSWFFLYKSDLPDIRGLSAFAPSTSAIIDNAQICGEQTRVSAIPTGHLSVVRNALFAAEGDPDPREFARRLYGDFRIDPVEHQNYGTYSLQLSRQLFCQDRRRDLRRAVDEVRTAHQIERRYTSDQILDIYLNRAYFGSGIYGIEGAARYYLGKPADGLSVPEAALLVGLLRGPTRLSPLTHPERALARRNEVIDTMLQRSSVTEKEAEEAKRAPLGVAVTPTPRQ